MKAVFHETVPFLQLTIHDLGTRDIVVQLMVVFHEPMNTQSTFVYGTLGSILLAQGCWWHRNEKTSLDSESEILGKIYDHIIHSIQYWRMYRDELLQGS